MPHIKPKAGQRVVLRELRGCMESDGLRVGDTGTVREVEIGGKTLLGVQFDRTDGIEGVYIRYASGYDSLVVNCCDALESVQNVTPVTLRLVCTQSGIGASESPKNGHSRAIPRRDGHFIRWGMHKSKYPLFRDSGLTKLVSGILLHRLGKRYAPGMTAKGVKWALEQEEVRA